MELFQSTINQLNKTKMTKVENALMWLYVKSWGMQGQHVIDKNDLWNFGGEDLEEAIVGIAYPRKKKTENKDRNPQTETLFRADQTIRNGRGPVKKRTKGDQWPVTRTTDR